MAPRGGHGFGGFQMHGHPGLAPGDQLAPEPFRQCGRRGAVTIGIDQHLGSDIVNVGGLEAVDDRNRQNAVTALHRLDAVDK